MRNIFSDATLYIFIGFAAILLGIFEFFLAIGKLFYKCMYFITGNTMYKWHAEHINKWA